MKLYIFPAILAGTILLAANYPKSSPKISSFNQEHLKSIIEELKEQKYLDSLKVVEEKAKKKQQEYLDSIQKSPKFTHFVAEIKQGKIPFKKWLRHKWLGNSRFGDKEAYFSRWETVASYPRSWYGDIWYFFEENLQRTTSKEEKWLMIFVKYYRDAKLIENLFNTYEPQIYKTITQKEFAQGNLKECFEELLKTHKVITQDLNYKNEFEKLKSAEDSTLNAYFFKMAFPNYEKKRRVPGDKIKGEDFHMMTKSGAETWFYSFWYRRYTEGNMEVVYKIIYKLYWHYQNQRKSIF
ncbi:MAG: hypothetical protein MUC49_09610 [Raineya sp.]|jgi:hypothetical protein|nr:hypothetical protein [Raineya sp.]